MLGHGGPVRAHGDHPDAPAADLAQAQGPHRHPHQLDHVHQRQGRGEGRLATVDPQGHRIVAVGIERHQLGRDPGDRHVVERTVQEHHPLGQEPPARRRQRLGRPASDGSASAGPATSSAQPCSILHSSRAPRAVV